MKTCSWCLVEKSTLEFNKKAKGAGGLSAHCRECQKKRHRERYAESKPHIKYYETHKEKLKAKRDACRDLLNEKSRLYCEKHPDKKRETVQKSRIKHRDRHLAYSREYKKKRLAKDPLFLIKTNLRSLILSAFKRFSSHGKLKTNKEYGINFEEIFRRIGNRPGTGREFHLDHIIPLAMFNLDNEDHVRMANSPQNLRWISKEENLRKGSTIPEIAYSDKELHAILVSIGCSVPV